MSQQIPVPWLTNSTTSLNEKDICKTWVFSCFKIAALDQLQILLHETEKDNLLVQSCKLHMECEILFTELQALSYFAHEMILPLLNFVETSSQKDLLQILPSLYRDLTDNNMHTPDKYHVFYKYLPAVEPDCELVKEILYLMCMDAAYVVKLQCGREYGFADDNQLPRATQLDKLTEDKLFRLPTNSLSTERN